MRILRLWYYGWKLREAERDLAYWQSEAELTALNQGVARARIEIARRKLFEARYPIKHRSVA